MRKKNEMGTKQRQIEMDRESKWIDRERRYYRGEFATKAGKKDR